MSRETLRRFFKGDRVTWVSQANGYSRTKTGLVVAVVPSRVRLGRVLTQEDVVGERSNLNTDTLPRRHESYVVRVLGRGLYWPRVSALKCDTVSPSRTGRGLNLPWTPAEGEP